MIMILLTSFIASINDRHEPILKKDRPNMKAVMAENRIIIIADD